MKPIPKAKQMRIYENLKDIYESGDMTRLTQETYEFVNILSGFIAHYDLEGFIYEYKDDPVQFFRELKLSHDVKFSERYIKDSFFSEGDNAEYYLSKYHVLILIAQMLHREKTWKLKT